MSKAERPIVQLPTNLPKRNDYTAISQSIERITAHKKNITIISKPVNNTLTDIPSHSPSCHNRTNSDRSTSKPRPNDRIPSPRLRSTNQNRIKSCITRAVHTPTLRNEHSNSANTLHKSTRRGRHSAKTAHKTKQRGSHSARTVRENEHRGTHSARRVRENKHRGTHSSTSSTKNTHVAETSPTHTSDTHKVKKSPETVHDRNTGLIFNNNRIAVRGPTRITPIQSQEERSIHHSKRRTQPHSPHRSKRSVLDTEGNSLSYSHTHTSTTTPSTQSNTNAISRRRSWRYITRNQPDSRRETRFEDYAQAF